MLEYKQMALLKGTESPSYLKASIKAAPWLVYSGGQAGVSEISLPLQCPANDHLMF